MQACSLKHSSRLTSREALFLGAQWAAEGRVQGECLHSAGNHTPRRPLRASAGAASALIGLQLGFRDVGF